MTLALTQEQRDFEASYADALELERDSFWTSATVAADYVEGQPTPKAKAAAVRGLAATGHCTRREIRIRVALALAFPADLQHADVSIPLFRACLAAAKRTGKPPAAILALALKENHHAKDVNGYGRRTTPGVPCVECGRPLPKRRAGRE